MPAIRPALAIHLRVTFVVVQKVGFMAQRFRKNQRGGCKKSIKMAEISAEIEHFKQQVGGEIAPDE